MEKSVNGRFVIVGFGYSICDGYICAVGGDDFGNGTDARLALGAAASLRGKGSRDEVLPRSPPLADLGKACAKFNGRSKLNNDKLIPSLSIRRGQIEI